MLKPHPDDPNYKKAIKRWRDHPEQFCGQMKEKKKRGRPPKQEKTDAPQ